MASLKAGVLQTERKRSVASDRSTEKQASEPRRTQARAKAEVVEIDEEVGGGKGDPYRLEGLDRVVAILDLLGESNRCLSLAEICQQMQLRKSTAHRALMALERTGLIERAQTHKFRLGLKLYDMGNRAVEQIDLRARVHPHLRKLALRLGETVHLGVMHKTRIVYVDKIEAINRRVCVSSRTGISNPVYSTSLGKAILAYMPAEEAAKIIAEIRFKRITAKTLDSHEDLMRALERVRRRGYAIDDEEMEIGTRCIGAPIFDGGRAGNRRVIAAVSISGATTRLAAHCVPGIAEHVMRCAHDLSLLLGMPESKHARLHLAAGA
jgi:DNA-binding IclR family transcriptional regulator